MSNTNTRTNDSLPYSRPSLEQLPGHGIRRLQQISVAVFLQETEAYGLTPVQFAALQCVADVPDVDQRTLARLAGLDTSTITGVLDRLESRGWLQRRFSPTDRRVRTLRITEAGEALLQEAWPAVRKSQETLLKPLSAAERKEFLRMLDVLITQNNALSRAPSAAQGK